MERLPLDCHLTKADFTYTATRTGYQVFYKGKPIYAAGLDAGKKGVPSNVTLFTQEAQYDINRILHGTAGQGVYDLIRKIEQEA